MQASSTIEAEIRRWVQSFEAKDQSVLDAFSRQSGAIDVGADTQEWWPRYERFKEMRKARVAEAPEMTFDVQRVVANEEGGVGWGVVDTVLTFSGMNATPSRLTVGCRREEGAWKTVLWQLWFSVLHEEAVAGSPTT